jgi:N-acetylmuramoyl-L-alanine amidase
MAELRDLVQRIATNTRVAESRVLAKALHAGVLAAVRKKAKVRDLGVKEAAFLVLANVEVPAVLVEMGYITDAGDAKKLNSQTERKKMMDALAQGVKNYLTKRSGEGGSL